MKFTNHYAVTDLQKLSEGADHPLVLKKRDFLNCIFKTRKKWG
jgi:hypothetical protein